MFLFSFKVYIYIIFYLFKNFSLSKKVSATTTVYTVITTIIVKHV